MSRPAKNDDDKRRMVLRVRLTDSEKAKISEAASIAGLSMSDFLRTRTMENLPLRRKLSPEKEALHAGLATLGNIGSDLRHMARGNVKTGNERAQISEVIQSIETLTEHLLKILEHGHPGRIEG